MALYNTLMRVVRPERGPFNWFMPRPVIDDDVRHMFAWKNRTPGLLTRAELQPNESYDTPATISAIQFQFPDIYGKEAINYFRTATPFGMNVLIQNQEQTEFNMQLDFNVQSVSKASEIRSMFIHPISGQISTLYGPDDAFLFVQPGSMMITKSTALTRAYPSLGDGTELGDYLVSVDNKTVVEGFQFDIWTVIEDESSNVEIAATNAFGVSRESRLTCSTRYDARIVAGLTLVHDGTSYQIQTVETIERLRTLRLSMTTRIGIVI